MILDILQILNGFLLIFLILLQSQGSGLSSTFGGEGNIFKTKTKEEKIIFYSTIGLSVSFVVISMINFLF